MDSDISQKKDAENSDKDSEISRDGRTSQNKDLPVGILRLDSGKPRRAFVEPKCLPQIEPTSPQPSVDRLSVTFAEDSLRSDASIRCNFFAPNAATPVMEKARFSPRGTLTDEENSDDEDYSASANAIMLRRASTKKPKRRNSRRTSSPFSPDILPGTENGQRRSSCFTTSSGDTVITVDESLAPEITQDQIFENIRLHKEVLSDVKMQPWPMRKKLRLVIQAKSYIKKHEGALQKRLAQSYSTRDMLARWNIYLIKRWQRLKREAVNFANWVIPWELRIKEIESHFGSVVASYFVFLRWLFWVNLVTSVILIAFVTVPESKYYSALKRITTMCFLMSMHSAIFYTFCYYTVACVSAIVFPIKDINPRRAYDGKNVKELTTFHFYREGHEPTELCTNDFIALFKSDFDFGRPTKFLVHGLLDDVKAKCLQDMKTAMLNERKWNVILVDWSSLSRTVLSETHAHSLIAGDSLGNFTDFLIKFTQLSLPDLHYIAHGLGTAVTARAAENILVKDGIKIGRITSLDPVRNFWGQNRRDLQPLTHLADVIHTDGDGFGTLENMGHLDYYPNGGKNQPGCSTWICNHLRSCEYWTKSLSCTHFFQAYSYNSWNDYLDGKLCRLRPVPMGIAADSTLPNGNYFLEIHPQLFLAADQKGAEDRKTILKEERYNATNFLTLWNFEGVLRYSPIFYGWYTDKDTDDKGYRRPLAYFMTGLAVYVYSFVATLRKMAENSRMSKLLEKDDEYTFSWKLFTGWDYMIGNAETAHNRIASIIMGFKEALLEEAEKKREDKNWKIITIRILVNATVVVLLLTSAYAVVEVVRRSMEPEAKNSVWRMNETTVVMNLITLCFPLVFEILGIFERYHPRKQLRIQLARIMALNLLNLYALIIAHFDEIGKMQVSLEDFKNKTLALKASNARVLASYNLTSLVLCNGSTAPKIQVGDLISTLALSAPALLNLIGKRVTYNGNTTWMDFENYTTTSHSVQFENDEDSELDFEKAIQEFLSKVEITTVTESFQQNFTSEDEFLTTDGSGIITESDPSTRDDSSFTEKHESPTAEDVSSIEKNAIKNVSPSLGYFETVDIKRMTTDYFSSTSVLPTYESTLSVGSEPTTAFIDDKVQNNELPKNCINLTGNVSAIPDYFSLDEASITRMDYKSRSQLRSLCWETVFGQELVKLTVMDLVMTIVSTLGMDFFRGVFIRVMNNCWCWDLEKTFPQYGDFKVAENILHLVNNQGMVWMGMFFSPGLIVLNVFKLYVLVYFRSWVVMTCNVPHKIVFRASRSNNFYFALLLLMLFLCVLPVGYAIVRVRPSWHCGPFSKYQLIFHIFTKSLKRALPKSLHKVLDYIASPGIVIPLLVLLILIIYYLISLTNALREANSDLKVQLRRERTEERRKMFQIADRRRRAGSQGSAEVGQTPLTKWKKLLHNLPGGKSFDDTPKQEFEELVKQPIKPEANKSKDFFSKFIKRALRKPSVTSQSQSDEDGGTDTEQPDSLPEDISSVKQARRVQSSFQKTVEAAVRQQKEEGRLSIDSNGKRAHGRRRITHSPSRSNSSKEVRQDSVASTWSDNIPVITISKTESAECIHKLRTYSCEKKDDRELLRHVEDQIIVKSSTETLVQEEAESKNRGRRVLQKQDVTEDESNEKTSTVIENKPEERGTYEDMGQEKVNFDVKTESSGEYKDSILS